ncbi:GNAT family protein [Methylomonas sp.]|jgi:RimJ/RimL family protein N-acetyltransferase|uniref:GNAT family N-acetyltransferase n=1 Tax=Methylomonas sp. TaxID=418 RepID=UPI0025CE5C49|nr:GNAT family protein [Methylomonas sp.]
MQYKIFNLPEFIAFIRENPSLARQLFENMNEYYKQFYPRIRFSFDIFAKEARKYWDKMLFVFALDSENAHTFAGFLTANAFSKEESGIVYLAHVIVEKSQRQRGIGAELVRAFAQWVAENRFFDESISRFIVDINTANHASLAAFKKIGFVEDAETQARRQAEGKLNYIRLQLTI